MKETDDGLESVIQTALGELLECYAGAAGELNAGPLPSADQSAFAASIRLTAEILRGTLVLVGRDTAVARALPPELGQGGVTADRLADWVAELSNQLAGRVKNKLLHYRVVVTLSVPSVQRAVDPRCYARKSWMPTGGRTARLGAKAADFEAWLDVELHSDIDFSRRHSVTPPPDEGELVFL